MPSEAAACCWSWDICGMVRAVWRPLAWSCAWTVSNLVIEVPAADWMKAPRQGSVSKPPRLLPELTGSSLPVRLRAPGGSRPRDRVDAMAATESDLVLGTVPRIICKLPITHAPPAPSSRSLCAPANRRYGIARRSCACRYRVGWSHGPAQASHTLISDFTNRSDRFDGGWSTKH
jgi:hypothetical protein